MVHHRTGVVDMDDGLLLHRDVVATTVGIDDRTAHHLKIGLVEFGHMEAHVTFWGLYLYNGCFVVFVALAIDGVNHLAFC